VESVYSRSTSTHSSPQPPPSPPPRTHTQPKKTFWVDFIAVAPFHIAKGSFLVAPSPSHNPSIEVARYLALLQIPFTLEVFQIFRRAETDVYQDVQSIALTKFLFFMVMSSHAMGCVWWWIASIFNFNCDTWLGQYLPYFLEVDADYVALISDNGTIAPYEDGKQL
jgi:hypothetical protein